MNRQKCAECGKEFEIGPAGWGYGYGSLYTCSYKCMRDMKRREAIKNVTTEEKQRADELYAQGKNLDEIAQDIGVNKIGVSTYLRKKAEREQQRAAEKPASPEGTKKDSRDMVLEILRGVVEILMRYTR